MRYLIIVCLFFTGCVDQNERLNNLKKMYPKCKVEPATGLVQNSGFDFIVIDSSMQIIAVDFYPFSANKIRALRNIR